MKDKHFIMITLVFAFIAAFCGVSWLIQQSFDDKFHPVDMDWTDDNCHTERMCKDVKCPTPEKQFMFKTAVNEITFCICGENGYGKPAQDIQLGKKEKE